MVAGAKPVHLAFDAFSPRLLVVSATATATTPPSAGSTVGMPSPTTVCPVDLALLSLDHPTLPRLCPPLSNSLAWVLRGATKQWAKEAAADPSAAPTAPPSHPIRVITDCCREGSRYVGGLWGIHLPLPGIAVSLEWTEVSPGTNIGSLTGSALGSAALPLGAFATALYLDDGTLYTRELAAASIKEKANHRVARRKKRGKVDAAKPLPHSETDIQSQRAWAMKGLHCLHAMWGRTLEVFYIQSRSVSAHTHH